MGQLSGKAFHPTGMSGPTEARLHSETINALDQADVRTRLKAYGRSPFGNTQVQYAGAIRDIDQTRFRGLWPDGEIGGPAAQVAA